MLVDAEVLEGLGESICHHNSKDNSSYLIERVTP
jgi:hypothetical protein